jgi:hypothetical protein
VSPNHSHRPNATIFRKAGGVPCPHGSTVPKPPLPLSMCIKVEEWLKSSEKTKVKLICTPHKLPLQKITNTKSSPLSHSSTPPHTRRPTETHPLFNFPGHFPHSSTSTTQNPKFTHSSTHSLFNFLYGLPNLAISCFLAHWGRHLSTHTRFLHDLTYLRNFVNSDNLCIQTYV